MIDRKHLVFPFAALLVAGCAASSDRYPSLAVRDVERAEGTFDPVPGPQLDVPEVEVDVGPDLGAGLTSLVADAQAAHTAFTDAVPAAERSVRAASGSSIGSDSWAAAQVALAAILAAEPWPDRLGCSMGMRDRCDLSRRPARLSGLLSRIGWR